MLEISELVKQTAVIKAVSALITQAAVDSGVSQLHAERIALGIVARIEEGTPIEPLNALVIAVRSAALAEAADVVDKARSWAEGDLRGPRDSLRAMARDPLYRGPSEDEDVFDG